MGTAAPSILLISLMAMLSFFGATILSRRWMRWFAFGCGALEAAMAIILIMM